MDSSRSDSLPTYPTFRAHLRSANVSSDPRVGPILESIADTYALAARNRLLVKFDEEIPSLLRIAPERIRHFTPDGRQDGFTDGTFEALLMVPGIYATAPQRDLYVLAADHHEIVLGRPAEPVGDRKWPVEHLRRDRLVLPTVAVQLFPERGFHGTCYVQPNALQATRPDLFPLPDGAIPLDPRGERLVRYDTNRLVTLDHQGTERTRRF